MHELASFAEAEGDLVTAESLRRKLNHNVRSVAAAKLGEAAKSGSALAREALRGLAISGLSDVQRVVRELDRSRTTIERAAPPGSQHASRCSGGDLVFSA
jgi:hypothetical protein